MPRITKDILRERICEQLSSTASLSETPALPDFSAVDLLSIPDNEAFLYAAYQRILNRPPDLDGMHHFLHTLETHSRQVVIDALTSAGQSGPAPVNIHAITPPTARPFVDLTDIDRIRDVAELLREGYRRILGREPDREGFCHYLAMLSCGVPKAQVLARIAASPEGRERKLEFLWYGDALQKPVPVSLRSRIKLLFWDMTGGSRVDDLLFSLDFERRATAARFEQLRSEIAGWRSHVDSVGLKLGENIQDAISEIRQASEISARSLKAGIEDLSNSLEVVTAAVESLRSEVRNEVERAGQHHQQLVLEAQRATEQRMQEMSLSNQELRADLAASDGRVTLVSAAVAGLRDELGKIAGEMKLCSSEEQTQRQAYQVEATAAMAGFRVRLDLLANAIRPPVLAGSDVLVTRVDDFVLAIPRDDWSLASHYAFWGTVDEGFTLCFKKLLGRGMRVVDIGANVGLHTLQAARTVGSDGRVYSFEPTPNTFSILSKNVQASGLTSIELFPCAVLDRRAQLPLYIHAGSSPLNTLFAEAKPRESILVEAMSLDEVLAGREKVDIVKIDAEGAEPYIFRGMKKVIEMNSDLVILLEFAPTHLQRAGVSPSEFLSELRSSGLQVSRVNDISGELELSSDEQLLASPSSNLCLRR